METRTVAELRPHPRNAWIYGNQADDGLIASVRAIGVLNPLLITFDDRIISGHRRHDAARRATLPTVPVVVFPSRDELDILEAVVESNRQRQRTGEILGREATTLLEIARERAQLRQLFGECPDLPDARPEGLDTSDTNVFDVPGDARDAVGAVLGVSGKKAEHAARVVGAIDALAAGGRKQEAEQLRTMLNNKSVGAAYNEARGKGYISIEEKEPKPEPKVLEQVTLAEWRQMDEGERTAVLSRRRSTSAKFNKQDTDSIEWAQWSWNPVTGCLHNCSYCYARDIANRFYPWKFTPAFLPSRLSAPANTAVPPEASGNIGYKNVFTCSMADLFGKWVPREWINAVLGEVADNPQWNFLFLTKFPTRLREFDFPPNAWLGTSVDAQARVRVAEEAFADVNASVKWLSCEPLLERLTFSRLDLFDWVVIGGASRSEETPEYRPPREWAMHLERQAGAAGCKVYEKANLLERRREYPGLTEAKPMDVPGAFKMGYLKRDVERPDEYAAEFR